MNNTQNNMTLEEVKKELNSESEDFQNEREERVLITLKPPSQMKSLLTMQKLKTHNHKGRLMSKEEQINDLVKRVKRQLEEKGVKVD